MYNNVFDSSKMTVVSAKILYYLFKKYKILIILKINTFYLNFFKTFNPILGFFFSKVILENYIFLACFTPHIFIIKEN